MRHPLDGITVVALEQAVAAPFATRQLADLGARVIKVERPGTGDFIRQYDRTVHGQSSYFVWLNRGKESIELDIKYPDDRDLLDRLIDGADVFVQRPPSSRTGRWPPLSRPTSPAAPTSPGASRRPICERRLSFPRRAPYVRHEPLFWWGALGDAGG
jgi:CoA-transferase family III